MHRFMLDSDTGTVFEGIWFTHGPVAICDDRNQILTYANMVALREAHADLELRWLDDADEWWDAEDLAVRSALRGWTYEGPSYRLPGSPPNTN